MKLIIILAVASCAFAAKLDRTYLPPAGAETAGGSPGSLNAPHGPQSSVPSFGTSFGGPNQPLGASSHGSFAPSSGGQNVNQGSNSRDNQGQVIPSGIHGTQSGNHASSAFLNQPSNSFGNTPFSFDQNTKPSNQELAIKTDFEQTNSQPERAQSAQDRTAEILRYDNEIDGDSFAYSFETSNGISAEESGVATNGVQAKGAFSYTGDDGQTYSITYTADENGYQPHGDHLPTPPPIPEEILRSIEENARAAAAGTQEGAYNEDENNSSYDGQRSNALQQQYQPQQSSYPSNQYSVSNVQNPAEPQQNSKLDATNNIRPKTEQSFIRNQLNQGHQVNQAVPSNQYGTSGAIHPVAIQGNTQFDNTNSPSTDRQNFQKPSADQQSSRPSNQYGVPGGQHYATPQKNNQFDITPLNNRQDLQRPRGGESFFRPQFNQGSQVYNQQSSRPSNQYSISAQRPITSSTDRYNSQGNQPAPNSFPSSTQFNAQSGYRYDRPIAKGTDAQPSQSSNFNMRYSSNSDHRFPTSSSQINQSINNSRGPQGSVLSYDVSARPSVTNQPSGFKLPSQNNSGSSQQYSAPSSHGQDFSGPRQPPSFSPEEGYKY